MCSTLKKQSILASKAMSRHHFGLSQSLLVRLLGNARWADPGESLLTLAAWPRASHWRAAACMSIVCCPASRTTLVATRFWVVMICPIIKCLTVLEFSFILFDLCLFITIFNFILNYVPIVTFWIFTYHKIWILLIIFCFIWSYWIIYFSTSLEVFWSVVS